MGLEILTQLLGLPGYYVKEIFPGKREIFLTVERVDFPICPKCRQRVLFPTKDRRRQIVEDLSVWGKRCKIEIYKYRINCPCGYCGTEHIDWLKKYERVTNRYSHWIYAFCKRMTGKDVATIFGISKHLVYRLDKEGIEKEMSLQKPINPTQLGVDEISRKKGHHYATIITDSLGKKVLDVIKGRKIANLTPFFKGKSKKWLDRIEIVSMDAWLGFRNVVQKYCKNSLICFDHFHLAQHFSKAIDKLRVQETRRATKKDKEIYKGTRWLLLKNPDKLSDKQKESLDTLLKVNQKLLKVYILRDRFRDIFNGPTMHSRLIRLAIWKKEAKSAKIGQITEFLKKIEKWEPYIKNSLREKKSNAFSEGLNNKVRVIQRMAYGYKDFEYLRLKIIQQFNFRDGKSIFDG